MSVISNIAITPVSQSRIKELVLQDLTYGKFYSDHMLVADYKDGHWGDLQIVPFGEIPISPTISALHYGQSIFEGLKAFKGPDGEARIFRHMENFRRMNYSAERMGMPQIPDYFFSEGLAELIRMDKDWIPSKEGYSLYIRPVMFATDEKIGVHISDSYKFVIFTTPVGLYFPKPLKVLVEKEFVRAVKGGVGYAKVAGNYGASMYPSKLAREQGYDQIIWTDALEHKYFEEAGTMNVMMVIGDTLITPQLSNTTLAGITRDSILTIARDWNVKTEERRISIDEVLEELAKGNLKEMFGVGTAATVTNIAIMGYNGTDYTLPPVTDGLLSQKIKARLNEIRMGAAEDTHKWMTLI